MQFEESGIPELGAEAGMMQARGEHQAAMVPERGQPAALLLQPLPPLSPQPVLPGLPPTSLRFPGSYRIHY